MAAPRIPATEALSTLTSQLRSSTGAVSTNLELAHRLATAPVDVNECVRVGCNGLPAGLPLSCFDPEKIADWGPPIRYKNPLTAIGCALAASVTPEGSARVAAAERTRTDAYFAAQRASDAEWATLNRQLVAWRARCPDSTIAQVVPSKGANVKGYKGLSYAVPVTPANGACWVVRGDMYEWQRELARFLKRKRSTGLLATPADQVRWCAQATSCASMAMQSLAIYGPNGLIPIVFPINIPFPRGKPFQFTVDGAWNEPSRRVVVQEFVGTFPIFEPFFIRSTHSDSWSSWLPQPKSEAPRGQTAQIQRYTGHSTADGFDPAYRFEQWAGWPPDASVVGAACSIIVPNEFPDGRRNPNGRHPVNYGNETHDSIYNRAIATVAANPSVAADMMNEAERWLDWLLALPNADGVLSAYLDAWMRSSIEWGPESLPWQDSQAIPLSYTDYRAVKDGDEAIAQQHLIAAATGLAQAIGSLVTLNIEGVISGLAQYSVAVLTRVASGHPPIVKPIYPPFCRWLADNDYNLDTSAPATAGMMARVCTALVRYQALLGMDWNIHLPGTDIPAGPADVPRIAAPPPPPSAATSAVPKIILGAAALGLGVALFKYLRS